MVSSLTATYADDIEAALHTYFERSIPQAENIDPSYRQLWTTLQTLIHAGGKRLRPTMTLLAYEAFGGTDTKAVLPAAVAQELLHFALLIHDDIIDRDYTRYGVENVAGRYKTIYAEHITSPEDITHYAHSAALLGGDLMISAAHEMVLTSGLSADDKLTTLGLLTKSIFDVAGGELLDTELSFVPYTTGRALKVAQYKTASYSFVGPLMTGAVLADATAAQKTALNTYALSLGIAYQLVDDLLGVFGDTKATGKSTSSDITEGKKTYMIEQALATITLEQKVIFQQWFGNNKASDEGIARVRELLVISGAKQRTEDKIHRCAEVALAAVTDMHVDEEYTTAFVSFVDKVTERIY